MTFFVRPALDPGKKILRAEKTDAHRAFLDSARYFGRTIDIDVHTKGRVRRSVRIQRADRRGSDVVSAAKRKIEIFFRSKRNGPVVAIDDTGVGTGKPGRVATRLREIYLEESRKAGV